MLPGSAPAGSQFTENYKQTTASAHSVGQQETGSLELSSSVHGVSKLSTPLRTAVHPVYVMPQSGSLRLSTKIQIQNHDRKPA